MNGLDLTPLTMQMVIFLSYVAPGFFIETLSRMVIMPSIVVGLG